MYFFIFILCVNTMTSMINTNLFSILLIFRSCFKWPPKKAKRKKNPPPSGGGSSGSWGFDALMWWGEWKKDTYGHPSTVRAVNDEAAKYHTDHTVHIHARATLKVVMILRANFFLFCSSRGCLTDSTARFCSTDTTGCVR